MNEFDIYFGEMNILKSDKVKRIKTANTIHEQLQDFFLRQLADIEGGEFLTVVSSEAYEDMLIDLYMVHSASKEDEWMRGRARRFADQIQSATEETVRGSAGKPEFTQALMFGIPMRKKDIPKKIQDALSGDRAARIAMNETNVIHNYQRHAELAGSQMTHTWDSTLDRVTRPHHWDADGQTVLINEPFVVAGERLMFPGDDSLGATAKNLINCRCVEL